MKTLLRFLHDQEGATAIEYALICAIMGVGVVGGVQAYGENLVNLYNGITDAAEPYF